MVWENPRPPTGMPNLMRPATLPFAAALLVIALAGCVPQTATPGPLASPTAKPVATAIEPAPVQPTPTEPPPCFRREELAAMDLATVASFPVVCFDPGYGPRTIVEQEQAIAVVRAFAQDPARLAGFREMTLMGNSPSGTLPVARFEDERGGSYLVALVAGKVLEMNIDPGQPQPGAPVLADEQLRTIAEDLVRRELADFDRLQDLLTFEAGAKPGGVNFFRWELTEWPDDGSMPPLAQVGVTDAGEVFSYINTLYSLE